MNAEKFFAPVNLEPQPDSIMRAIRAEAIAQNQLEAAKQRLKLAISQYEDGLLSAARQNIAHTLSLTQFYPMSLTIVYAKALDIKIRARLYGVHSALPVLEKLWEQTLKAHPGNLNTILALARTQADLNRLQERDFTAEALAAYFIARELNDTTETLISLAELAYSPHATISKSARALLSEGQGLGYAKALELLNPKGSSETAKSFRVFIPENKSEIRKGLMSQPDFLYIARSKTRIFLRTRSTLALRLQPKVARVIETLSLYRLNEADLFSIVWKGNYSRVQHQKKMKTALRRVQKIAGLSVKHENQVIELSNSVIIP